MDKISCEELIDTVLPFTFPIVDEETLRAIYASPTVKLLSEATELSRPDEIPSRPELQTAKMVGDPSMTVRTT